MKVLGGPSGFGGGGVTPGWGSWGGVPGVGEGHTGMRVLGGSQWFWGGGGSHTGLGVLGGSRGFGGGPSPHLPAP